MPCNCLFKYSKVTLCINWTSWSCRCVYRQLLISSTRSVSLQWVSWPRSQSQVSIMLCLSKYSVLLSRALQQRQDTVLGQSRGVWSWAGSWSVCSQQVLSSFANLPGGIWGQKAVSWVGSFLRRQFSAFIEWSLPLFFTVTAGSPICIHTDTCPIPLCLKDQPSSRLWWPPGSNVKQLRPWGELHISLLLSDWAVETTCSNYFLRFLLENWGNRDHVFVLKYHLPPNSLSWFSLSWF